MTQWKRLVTNPTGAIPGGMFGRVAVGLTSLMIAAFVISYSIQGDGDQQETPVSVQEDVLADERIQRRADRRIEERQRQEQLRQAAQARDRLRAQMQQRATSRPRILARSGVQTAGMPQGVASQGYSAGEQPLPEEVLMEAEVAEQQLLHELKLQAIRRKHESLRSEPVAHSVRSEPRQQPQQTAPGGVAPPPRTAPVARPSPHAENIRQLQQTAADLRQLANQSMAAQPVLSGDPVLPAASGLPPAVVPNQPPAHSAENPGSVSTPADPEGFERIYEGSFLEGAMVTQLSGDFPGPVLAQVSVPFYSSDRQRVLIPRGSRVIGTAQAVRDRDQSRLAVGFHRLILPDGRWVSLKFEGLDQVGATALKDKVNRHYLQMFAAAGAIGILSGLTLRGSNPYAGGIAGFRAGAGQGFGQAAIQIMQRFLNRLPTITIRAGHRLRIWFTADVLVPRKAQPQRGNLRF